MEKKKLYEIIGISCAGVGFLLSFIFTFISCNASAKNVTEGDTDGSLLFIVVAIGAIIAIAGAVFAFLSREAGTGLWNGFSIMAIAAFGLCVVTLLFATFPHITICAYNCKFK